MHLRWSAFRYQYVISRICSPYSSHEWMWHVQWHGRSACNYVVTQCAIHKARNLEPYIPLDKWEWCQLCRDCMECILWKVLSYAIFVLFPNFTVGGTDDLTLYAADYFATKCGVLMMSLFVFFTTTMSVSFTLRETQTRMLKFTGLFCYLILRKWTKLKKRNENKSRTYIIYLILLFDREVLILGSNLM